MNIVLIVALLILGQANLWAANSVQRPEASSCDGTKDSGSNINKKNWNDYMSQELDLFFPSLPPLLVAAAKGGILEITELLEEGEEPLICDENGSTALFYAIFGRHLDVVNFLTNYAPGMNAVPDNQGNTPLHYVAKEGLKGFSKLLLDPIVPDENNDIEMCIIINRQTLEIIGAKNKDGYDPLTTAVNKDHQDTIAEIILCKDALINNISILSDSAPFIGNPTP